MTKLARPGLGGERLRKGPQRSRRCPRPRLEADRWAHIQARNHHWQRTD